MAARGNIEEIFDTVQGEGPLAGVRQIFVRLGGCNLACSYCDTPQARRPAATCRVETVPASGRYDFIPNTIPVPTVVQVVRKLRIPGHHSVSVTGGEPLVQPDFLRELLPELRQEGHRIYLETNATLPDELTGIIEHVHYVSADIKLSSCTGEENRFDANLEFLRRCGDSELFVKLVISEDFDADELLEAVSVVKSSGRAAPVVLQPVTGRRGAVSIGGAPLLEIQKRALQIYPDIRVIPRIHQPLQLA